MRIGIALVLLVLSPLAIQAQTRELGAPKAGAATPVAQEPAPAADAARAADGPTAAKPIDPAKEAAIRKFFVSANVRKLTQETMDGMLGNVRQTLINILPQADYRDTVIDLFVAKFKSKMDVDKLLDLMVPVYDKYYTVEDLEAATKFYETPSGKRMLEMTPKILVESASIGGKWGEELGKKSMTEVLDEHPEIKKAIENGATKLPQN